MRTKLIITSSPSINLFSGVINREKPIGIEAFVTELIYDSIGGGGLVVNALIQKGYMTAGQP